MREAAAREGATGGERPRPRVRAVPGDAGVRPREAPRRPAPRRREPPRGRGPPADPPGRPADPAPRPRAPRARPLAGGAGPGRRRGSLVPRGGSRALERRRLRRRSPGPGSSSRRRDSSTPPWPRSSRSWRPARGRRRPRCWPSATRSSPGAIAPRPPWPSTGSTGSTPRPRKGREARARLAALSGLVPARSAPERASLLLERGKALLAAGRTIDAIAALRAVPLAHLSPADADLARVRLGRALLARKAAPGRPRAARCRSAATPLTRPRPPSSSRATTRAARAAPAPTRRWPTASRGRRGARRHSSPSRTTTRRTPSTTRRCPGGGGSRPSIPQGRYVERAVWRTGWGDYRARRYEAAAQLFETTARLRPPSGSTAGFLYWSGRARLALGQKERARALLSETVQRYKHAYHGVRASEQLARLGGRPAPRPVLVATTPRAGGAPPGAAGGEAPPAAARRPPSRGGRRAAPAARVAAGAGHARLGRLAAGPLSSRHHHHEARLPGVGRRGGRPARPRGLADPLPPPLRPRAPARRAGGRGGPRARGRAHPPGVELRRGRPQPRRGARAHAGDAGHRDGRSPARRASGTAARPCTTRRPASTSARTTCGR